MTHIPMEVSYKAIKDYAYRLRLALNDLDPLEAMDAKFELAKIEGVLAFMKEHLEVADGKTE